MNDESRSTQASGTHGSSKPKKRFGRFKLISVLLLLVLGVWGVSTIYFEKMEIQGMVDTHVNRAYPALALDGQPQVVEFLSLEGGTMSFVDVMDRKVVVALMEMTTGEFAGYRFRQRIELEQVDETRMNFIFPPAPVVLMQRFEEGKLQSRLYILDEDRVYDLPEFALEKAGQELTVDEINVSATVDGSEVFIQADCGCDDLDDLFKQIIPDLLRQLPELFKEADPLPKRIPKELLNPDPKQSV